MSHRNFNERDSTLSTLQVTDQLSVVEEPLEHTVDYADCSVLLCAKCNTVLADSLGVCGEARSMQSIICLKVTNDVRLRGKFEVQKGGPFAFCAHKVLECGTCHHFVGVVLYSTPPHLSSLRNLFLLRNEALNCYMLRNCAVVKASKVSFEIRPLTKRITKLKQDLEAQMKKLDMLKEMLEESSTRENPTQCRQSSSLHHNAK